MKHQMEDYHEPNKSGAARAARYNANDSRKPWHLSHSHRSARADALLFGHLPRKEIMNTSYGWIKLYRCLLDDPLWQCGTNEQKIILITLLLMANHAEAKWQWNGRPYHCKPGQMITSLNSIQEKIGKRISLFQIRYAIKHFEMMGFLINKSSKTGRLITICNWESYQSNDKMFHNEVAQIASTSPQLRHQIVTTSPHLTRM